VSQYPFNPSPYQPPTLNYGGWQMMPQEALRPARVAAILQSILGAVLVFVPTCAGALVMAARAQFVAIFQAQINNMQLPAGTTANDVLMAAFMMGAVNVVVGLILIVLAIFVRRASRIGSIISIALTGIVGLVMLLTLLNGLRQMAANPSGGAMFALILLGGGLALCAATIAKLALIVRSGQDLHTLAMQQSQYWAMMQQQGGYGYGYPPPPPDGARPVGAPPPPPATPEGPQNPPPPAGGSI
jgi:hypothetical protein